jgi:hypothetical protein
LARKQDYVSEWSNTTTPGNCFSELVLNKFILILAILAGKLLTYFQFESNIKYNKKTIYCYKF